MVQAGGDGGGVCDGAGAAGGGAGEVGAGAEALGAVAAGVRASRGCRRHLGGPGAWIPPRVHVCAPQVPGDR